MAGKFVHQGASSVSATYFRVGRCIYSGNEKMYDSTSKYWSEEKQNALNIQFMQNDCDCRHCTEQREDRRKLIDALRRDHDTSGLQVLGVYE